MTCRDSVMQGDSNWVSGISFIDNALYGNQKQLPQTVGEGNKSYNKLYMLPFILGIAGLFIQYKRKRNDFLVNTLLFFLTGLAIVIYLNQSGYQPRERDYAYVGHSMRLLSGLELALLL